MRDRILLQSFFICLLIGGGTYLLMGSADAMKHFAYIAGSVNNFLSVTAPRLLTSPAAVVSVLGLAGMAVVARARKSCTGATR